MSRPALHVVADALRKQRKDATPRDAFQFATVTTVVSNGAYVQFDSETTPRAKKYQWIGDTPVVGAHVAVAWVPGANTYFILGAIAPSAPWADYTPDFANVTVGNGTVVGRWQLNQKTMSAMGYLVFGSTTSVTSNPIYVAMPPVAPRSSHPTLGIVGQWAAATSAGAQGGGYMTRSGSYGRMNTAAGANTSATVPVTFAAGSLLSWSYSYEVS